MTIEFYHTVKEATIADIKSVLKSRKKFYLTTDFPFTQMLGGYLTYQARVMNEYLRENGYIFVRAGNLNMSALTKKKIRTNKNVILKLSRYISYKRD
jgi:hypothetical protein